MDSCGPLVGVSRLSLDRSTRSRIEGALKLAAISLLLFGGMGSEWVMEGAWGNPLLDEEVAELERIGVGVWSRVDAQEVVVVHRPSEFLRQLVHRRYHLGW